MNNPYKSYQQNAVYTASPGELTLMLYNGCLKFIKLAKNAIHEENVEAKNTNLIKAQNIIHEFMVTLNMDVSLSNELMVMYEYMHRRLVEANIKSDLAILEEVEGLVTEYRDTWKQVIQLNRQTAICEERTSLMEAIKAFHQATNQLIELLQQEKLDRDVRIEKVQSLLDHREELLQSIKPPFTEQETELGKQLVQLEQQVKQLLQKQKQEIQQDMKQLRMKKESSQKYTNPYESMPVDGLFYDKQK